MLDDELVKKLRTMQARKLKDSEHSVSFSMVLNEMLAKSLK